ncbi:MAG: ABC transporter substrate-binding protein [Bdellovibrionota bacterium]
MKKLFLFLFLIILPCNLLAEDDSTIKIGGAFALTGIGAPFGTGELNGLKLAIEDAPKIEALKNKTIKLIIEDTKSSNLGTVNAVKKLVEIEKIDYLIGPTWVDTFGGALPILDKARILTITPSAVPEFYKKSTEDFKLVFSTWYNNIKEVEALLKFVSQDGNKQVALIFDQDPYFQANADLMQKISSRIGIKIVKRIDLAIGDKNFGAPFLKLKQLKVDAIIFGLLDDAAVNSFMKRRVELLSEHKFYGFHDIDGYVAQEMFANLLGGINYIRPLAPEKKFSERYNKVNGAFPIISASNSYDAGKILLTAIANGATASSEIAEYLAKNSFETVTFGETRFNTYGAVTGGEFELVRIK